MLGYFETSAVWRGCHSVIEELCCHAQFSVAFHVRLKQMLYICLSLKRNCQKGDDVPAIKI